MSHNVSVYLMSGAGIILARTCYPLRLIWVEGEQPPSQIYAVMCPEGAKRLKVQRGSSVSEKVRRSPPLLEFLLSF